MECDAKRLDHPDGGFTCSVLGDVKGIVLVWDDSPYKQTLKIPECNASVACKKGLFGEKHIFNCCMAGKFEVHPRKAETLKKQIESFREFEEDQKLT